jgi:hypothetical protein
VRKIPTVFQRDWDGDRSRVTRDVTPGCEWVLAGEGTPTRKYDGTCCLVADGILFKRRELKAGSVLPAGFVAILTDRETGKTVGWVPVGDGPDDRWHREAFGNWPWPDGTYELLGPKIQGNPEHYSTHVLVRHADADVLDVPDRSYDGIRAVLEALDVEGIVFHHPDGCLAKIKGRDFGIGRPTR